MQLFVYTSVYDKSGETTRFSVSESNFSFFTMEFFRLDVMNILPKGTFCLISVKNLLTLTS